jgi:hypothetical protein
MILAVRIKLVVAETPEIPLPGAKVALYDRDERSMDDFLGTGVTDEKGEVRIAFESEAYTDEEDLPLWKLDSLPLVPLAHAQNALVTHRQVAGLTPSPLGLETFKEVYFAQNVYLPVVAK